MEWISVKDRLPDDIDRLYLVYTGGVYDIAALSSLGNFYDPDNLYEFEGASHWMPLPEPPGMTGE